MMIHGYKDIYSAIFTILTMPNSDNVHGMEKPSPPLLQNAFALYLFLLVKDAEVLFAISGSRFYCIHILRFSANQRWHG